MLVLPDSLGVIILLARWRSRGGVNDFRSVADFHWRIASSSILWARRDPSPQLQQVSCHDNQSHDCLMMLVGFTAIRRREMGWADDDHPLVFLFLGSSGIGKRHTVCHKHLNLCEWCTLSFISLSVFHSRPPLPPAFLHLPPFSLLSPSFLPPFSLLSPSFPSLPSPSLSLSLF